LFNFTKILAFFLLFAVNLFAQEISSGLDSITTEEIIVNANRVKTSMLLAPNKIQVLDEKLIGSVNGSRLSDVLVLSDAVFIKDYGFNSGLKTISLNSTQSEQTLILLDGVKLNGQDNSQLDISLLQLDDISRIEISSGGLSALYGSEAIGGVINILTKKNDLNKPLGIELKGTYGSYGLKKIYGKVFQQFNKKGKRFIDYNISYSNESSKNNYEYNYFNGITTVLKERGNDDYFNHLLNFDFNVKLNNKSDLKIFTNYNYWNRNLPGLELGYTPGTAKQIDRDVVSSVMYNRTLSKTLNLKSNFDYKYTLRSYFDTATFNLSTKINSFYKLNSYVQSSAFSYIPSKVGELDFGYEASYNNIKSDQTNEGNLLHGGLYTAGKYELKTAIVSKVTFYPSLRYDYFSNINDKNVITAKAGLNIKPLEKIDFSLKSSFSNNFRAPSFDDLYWKDLGNPDLKPEKSISFDAGFFLGFNFFSGNEIEFSYFNINATDRIVWTPGQGDIWRPINIGKVKSEGIDLSFKNRIEFSKKINTVLHFNYNYANSLKKNEDFPGDPSYNKQMLYIPKENFKASLMFNYLTSSKIIKFVSLNAFYSYSGTRYMNPENSVFVPNYGLVDANLGIGLNIFKADAELKLAADNIFNEDYQVIAGYPMPLRNYRLQISFKY
jgi:vitamin B12 transporter